MRPAGIPGALQRRRERAVALLQDGYHRCDVAVMLAFIDESGFLIAPLVRRPWASRGATVVLYPRTRSQQKVSVIGALCVPPTRDREPLIVERCRYVCDDHPPTRAAND